MIFLCTVWHSGTHSLKSALPRNDIYWQHCSPNAVDKCRSGDYEWIATTYRDVYRVAASWSNRDQRLDGWKTQWDCWGEIIQIPKTKIFRIPCGEKQHGIFIKTTENQHSDTHGMHKALDAGDMDYFYSRFPEDLIKHALSTAGLQRAKIR